MILPYAARLVCLCFASFFLLHGFLGFAAFLAAPAATRAGESMRPKLAAHMLFGLRMLPAVLAAAAVAALCVPSYLRLEGNTAGERVGMWCCAAALLGIATCADSLARGAKALWITTMFGIRCQLGSGSQSAQNSAEGAQFVATDSEFALVALTGIIRPKIVVSRAVLGALSTEELECALEHERAHLSSHDNFKRLLLALTPEIFPFSHAFMALERSWARYREWAADDDAVRGDSQRALSLAAALVRMARMGAPRSMPPLASSLCDANDELSTRVERLLGARVQNSRPRDTSVVAAIAGTLALGAVALMVHPLTLYSVHALLERLVR